MPDRVGRPDRSDDQRRGEGPWITNGTKGRERHEHERPFFVSFGLFRAIRDPDPLIRHFRPSCPTFSVNDLKAHFRARQYVTAT